AVALAIEPIDTMRPAVRDHNVPRGVHDQVAQLRVACGEVSHTLAWNPFFDHGEGREIGARLIVAHPEAAPGENSAGYGEESSHEPVGVEAANFAIISVEYEYGALGPHPEAVRTI